MTDPFQTSVECADFTPLGDFVLIRRLPDPDEERGLIVPGTARDNARGVRRGVVEKCGPGDKIHAASPLGGHHDRQPMNVKPGDIVLYDRVPANDVNIKGQMYTLGHEEQHCLAVIGHVDIPQHVLAVIG